MTNTTNELPAGFIVGLEAESSAPYFRPGKVRGEWTENDLDYYAGREMSFRPFVKGREAYVVGRCFAHACKMYSHGWDTVLECYSATEILEVIRETGVSLDAPLAEILTAVADELGLEVRCDYGNDIRAAGGLSTTEYKLGV